MFCAHHVLHGRISSTNISYTQAQLHPAQILLKKGEIFNFLVGKQHVKCNSSCCMCVRPSHHSARFSSDQRFCFYPPPLALAPLDGGRSSAGEAFHVQEMSDSDNDGLEHVLATTPLPSSPTADVAAASAVINVGHQRASLELRNLALEREASVYSREDAGVRNRNRHVRNMRTDPTIHHRA